MAKGDTSMVERDIAKDNKALEERKAIHYRDGSKGIVTPYDVPVYVRVHQVMEETENHKPPKSYSKGVKASIVELDYFTFGIKVLVRNEGFGPDAVLKVFVQDSEGTDKVAEYEKG